MTKKIFVSILFLLFSINLILGQDRVYVDENMNIIDKKTYKKKCRLNIYVCKKNKSDSVVINKVYDKYEFGKISIENLEKLKTLIFQNSGIKINPTKNIIIKYNDSLFGYNSTVERSKRHYEKHRDHFNNSTTTISKKSKLPNFKPIKLKDYTRNHINYIKEQKKCIERAKTVFNSQTFYTYNYDQGHNMMWPDLNWIQDETCLLKKAFFKIPNYGGMMILKSDGSFFISNVILSEKIMTTLFTGNWSTLKQDWIKTKQEHIKKGFGHFKIETNFKRYSCF